MHSPHTMYLKAKCWVVCLRLPGLGAIRRFALASTIPLALSATGSARAGFTFLGPSPYLSKADSPFPVDGSHPDFYLEDFEANAPCVPDEMTFCSGAGFDSLGVRMTQGNAVRGPSVDADDHVIDGSGITGGSASAKSVMIIGSSAIVSVEFEFDADEIGFFPTAVGLVLTDGAGPGSGLGVYDAAGNYVSFLTFDLELDALTTSDDRFIGVINPDGISRIEFTKRIFDSAPTASPRIDHLQYGLLVPEPNLAVPTYWGLASALAAWRNKRRAPQTF